MFISECLRNRHLAEWRFLLFTMIVTVKGPICNVIRMASPPSGGCDQPPAVVQRRIKHITAPGGKQAVSTAPPPAALRRLSTVTAIKTAGLSARCFCRILESASLHPPPAAHRRLSTVTAIKTAGLSARCFCRILESASLHPPQAALRRFPPAAVRRTGWTAAARPAGISGRMRRAGRISLRNLNGKM